MNAVEISQNKGMSRKVNSPFTIHHKEGGTMCTDLRQREDQTPVIGYKLVYKDPKTGRYKSSAMGFTYRKDGIVPKVKVQKRLDDYWAENILDSISFKKEQVGRSAAFLRKEDVQIILPNHVIVKVRVEKDLLEGIYAHAPVVLGRRLFILEEVSGTGI
jgi:hypothetical protein